MDAEKARHLPHPEAHRLSLDAEIFQSEGQLVPDLVCDDLILRLLQNKADSRRLLPLGYGGERLAVQQHRPGLLAVGRENGFQMAQQRGFAAAGGAAQQREAAGLQRERHVLQGGTLCEGIGKRQIADLERAHARASFRRMIRGSAQSSAKQPQARTFRPVGGANCKAG